MSIIEYENDQSFKYNNKFDINESTKLLLIISQIKTGEKLYTTNKQFVICQNSKLDKIYRYFFGENGDKNMTRLQEIYSRSFALVANILSENTLQGIFYKQQLKEALLKSKNGLNNWLTSYNDDADINAQMSILHKNIDLNIALLSKSLDNINPNGT